MSGMQLSQEFKERLLSGNLPDGIWKSRPQKSALSGKVVALVKVTGVKLHYDMGTRAAWMRTYFDDLEIGRFDVRNLNPTDTVTFNCKMIGEEGLDLGDVLSVA